MDTLLQHLKKEGLGPPLSLAEGEQLSAGILNRLTHLNVYPAFNRGNRAFTCVPGLATGREVPWRDIRGFEGPWALRGHRATIRCKLCGSERRRGCHYLEECVHSQRSSAIPKTPDHRAGKILRFRRPPRTGNPRPHQGRAQDGYCTHPCPTVRPGKRKDRARANGCAERCHVGGFPGGLAGRLRG